MADDVTLRPGTPEALEVAEALRYVSFGTREYIQRMRALCSRLGWDDTVHAPELVD